MEFVTFEAQCSQLLVGYFNLSWITVSIDCSSYGQSGLCGSVGDEIYYDLKAHQRTSTPVLCDEAEEAMFDFVPFAGSGWEVTDEQLHTQIVSQLL